MHGSTGTSARPVVELIKRAHNAGHFINPRREVEPVAHPRQCFRHRALLVERLGRKLHTIEHGLELQERGVTPLMS